MKIVCVGGGPAGLYFAISLKRRDPAHHITLIDRDPPEATYGWGVTYGEDTLDMLYENDPESAHDIRAGSVLFQDQAIHVHRAGGGGAAETAYLAGYGYSMARATLLDVLTRRAVDLGVEVQHGRDVTDLTEFQSADLVVAADGANSRVRLGSAEDFGTRITHGKNPYIWLGTDKALDTFTFVFEETSAGWIWLYGYPSVAGISTCIVECQPQTWEALGFDTVGSEEGVRVLEDIFGNWLDGRSLISKARGEHARWGRFPEVTNEKWYHENIVLLGDAAHTTHFTIGSGTVMALADAVKLAEALYEFNDLSTALRKYDKRRRADLHPVQASARASMVWFEKVDRYLDGNAVEFAYSMTGRAGGQGAWQYQLHRADQISAVRTVRRLVYSSKRRWLSVRRGG